MSPVYSHLLLFSNWNEVCHKYLPQIVENLSGGVLAETSHHCVCIVVHVSRLVTPEIHYHILNARMW